MESYRIMLVEDEPEIRKGLRVLIEQVIGGFQIALEAENGIIALEQLRTSEVDLIITDIRMPVMSGIDFIKKLRGSYPDVAVIVISGYEEFSYAKEAMRYDVADYLLKPISRTELAQYLHSLKERLDKEKRGNQMSQSDDEDQTIRLVKQFVLTRLDQDVSLQYVAEQVYLNPQYLSALFKTKTGGNYSDYVTACRMDKAKKLLVESKLKIYEIAHLCGYSNANHFMGVFRQVCGYKPSEYRNITVQ